MYNKSRNCFCGPRAFLDLSFLISDLISYYSALLPLLQAILPASFFSKLSTTSSSQGLCCDLCLEFLPTDLCQLLHPTALLQSHFLIESFTCHFIQNYKHPCPTLYILLPPFFFFFCSQLFFVFILYCLLLASSCQNVVFMRARLSLFYCCIPYNSAQCTVALKKKFLE